MTMHFNLQLYRFTRLIPLLILVLLPVQYVAADINLSFGLYTTDKPTAMVKAYRPILNRLETDLAKKTGEAVKISLKISSTYEKGVNALTSGQVDFAKLGPAPYVSAYQKNPDIRIIALDSKGDSKFFNGVICVHKDSAISSIEDLKGKSFAFGNKGSTIGRYLSQAHLYKHGITVTDLSDHAYLGRHDKVGYAVSQKTFDAGALKEGTYKKLVKSGAELKVLAKFKNVNKPWVASSQMSEEIFLSLQAVMLDLANPDVFKPFSRNRFVRGQDSDFELTRDAILNNSKFFDNAAPYPPQVNVVH